jgi:hypothetical protein
VTKQRLALLVVFPALWLIAYVVAYPVAFHVYRPIIDGSIGMTDSRTGETVDIDKIRTCSSRFLYVIWSPMGWLETKIRGRAVQFVLIKPGGIGTYLDPKSDSLF